MAKEKVLITGGAGFIGGALALKLTELNYDVTIFDSLSPQIHGEDSKKSQLFQRVSHLPLINCDIRDREKFKEAILDSDVIVHLAAETGTGQSMYQIAHYSDVNIGATSHLMDVLANEKHEVRKVIVASSRAIYGEGKYLCDSHGVVYPENRSFEAMTVQRYIPECPTCGGVMKDLPTSEDSMIRPVSMYGLTKFAQENICLIAGRALGIPVVAYRFQNVYGPGQSLSNPYTGILSIFSTRAIGNKPIDIFEDGLESRDFVYVDDVVSSIILGIEKATGDYQVFNVGTGKKSTVIDIATQIRDRYMSRSEISISHKFRTGDIRTNYADLGKIEKALGFSPHVDLATGLDSFCSWVLQQELPVDKFDQSIAELKLRGLLK